MSSVFLLCLTGVETEVLFPGWPLLAPTSHTCSSRSSLCEALSDEQDVQHTNLPESGLHSPIMCSPLLTSEQAAVNHCSLTRKETAGKAISLLTASQNSKGPRSYRLSFTVSAWWWVLCYFSMQNNLIAVQKKKILFFKLLGLEFITYPKRRWIQGVFQDICMKSSSRVRGLA